MHIKANSVLAKTEWLHDLKKVVDAIPLTGDETNYTSSVSDYSGTGCGLFAAHKARKQASKKYVEQLELTIQKVNKETPKEISENKCESPQMAISEYRLRIKQLEDQLQREHQEKLVLAQKLESKKIPSLDMNSVATSDPEISPIVKILNNIKNASTPKGEYHRLGAQSSVPPLTTSLLNDEDEDTTQARSPKHKRRHRLLEAFLYLVLKVGWENVHNYAEKLEPIIDDDLEELIYQATGRPTKCPHGDPIPEKNGSIVIPNDVLLSKVALRNNVMISRVKTKNNSSLQFLEKIKIIPGEKSDTIKYRRNRRYTTGYKVWK